MKDGRVIRHGIAWDEAEYDGTNHSGYVPLDDRILVKMDTAAATTFGLLLPEDQRDKYTQAAETGVIIACGPAAFAWNESGTRPFTGEQPGPGDRVYVSKYSGQLLHGEDQQIYRVMDSRCIGAVRVRRDNAPPAKGDVPAKAIDWAQAMEAGRA